MSSKKPPPFNKFRVTSLFKNHLSFGESGAALLSLVITMPFLIMIALNYTQLGTNNFSLARKDQFRTMTQMTADAGLDYGMTQITADPDWTGTGSEITFDTTNNIKTTYNIVVADVDSDSKTMTSVAKLYRPATSATPQNSITIKADLRKVTSGDFSIVTGVGGLIMENSSKVLGGSVFVNGDIRMKNTSQIGLLLSPVTLRVAHQNCPVPANATYPRLCASGENGQPIQFENSARIYGSVYANNQISGANMSNPGLVASSGVVAEALPPHDRDAQKAAVAVTRTGSDASCTSNGGTKTWAANTKITGNVTIEKSCTVTILGDAWITGTVLMKNSGKIRVDNTLGTNRPNIMVDGSSIEMNNTSTLESNSSNTGIQLLSYYSTASCSPDCTSVTGSDLATSRQYSAIELDNTASGPNSIFYARWAMVEVHNSGSIGALVGQTIFLKNSATVTFGTSVSTGTSYWILDGYRKTF